MAQGSVDVRCKRRTQGGAGSACIHDSSSEMSFWDQQQQQQAATHDDFILVFFSFCCKRDIVLSPASNVQEEHNAKHDHTQGCKSLVAI